jgi:hypothetical protein
MVESSKRRGRYWMLSDAVAEDVGPG